MFEIKLTFSEALAVYKNRQFAVEKHLYSCNEEIEDNIAANMVLAEKIVDELALLSPEAIRYVEKEIERVQIMDEADCNFERETEEPQVSPKDEYYLSGADEYSKSEEDNDPIEVVCKELKSGTINRFYWSNKEPVNVGDIVELEITNEPMFGEIIDIDRDSPFDMNEYLFCAFPVSEERKQELEKYLNEITEEHIIVKVINPNNESTVECVWRDSGKPSLGKVVEVIGHQCFDGVVYQIEVVDIAPKELSKYQCEASEMPVPFV